MKLDNTELTALEGAVRGQIAAASGSINSDVSQDRSDLMDRYFGEPYGDEVEGRSAVVMSDVADTIEWIKPELLEIFTAGDKAAELVPVDGEDVKQAAVESAALNHMFYQQNNGFLVLYEWITDGLLQKNGYVRSDWDDHRVIEIDEYRDISLDALTAALEEVEAAGGKYEVLEQELGIQQMQVETPEGPQSQEIEYVKRVKVRVERTSTKYTIETSAPEDMEVAARWSKSSLEGVPFAAARADRPVSWLIEKGFDRDQAEALNDRSDNDTEEEISRFTSDGATEDDDEAEADTSTREVVVREAYIRYDINDDGRSELLKVWIGGEHGKILKWASGEYAIEEVDSIPFSGWSPIIVPHRHVGRSVAELVDDLQRIRTVLARQMLDNIYQSNNARKVVYEDAIGEHTISDLLDNVTGGIIRAEGAPGGIQFEVPPNLVQPSLAALQFIDDVRENRTGVTKYNQGLDSDSLNKTSSGITKILSQSQKKVLLIARIFAETGMKDLFRRMHRDLRRGPSTKLMIKMGGEFLEVDPTEWRDRDDMTINVGLGTGDVDAQLQRLMMLRQAQSEDAQYGLVGVEERAKLNKKLEELMGFKGGGFFKDADQVEPPQEQQDPTMMMLQAQMQVEEQKHQLAQAELMLKSQMAKAEDDRKRDETNVKAAVDMAKIESGEEVKVLDTVMALNQPG